MAWIEIERDDGRPLFINLGVALAIDKAPDGKAIMISLAGFQLTIDAKYDDVVEDITGSEGEDG